MSGGRLLIVAACLLVGAVVVAMWMGLSGEPERARLPSPPSSATPEPSQQVVEEIDEADPPDAVDDEEEEPVLEGERTLSGTVRDRAGERLAGAAVEIGDLYTLSEDDGTYHLVRVPLERTTLVVTARGYAEGRVAVDRGVPDADEHLDVTLEDGDEVAGKVLDPDGKPADNAEVRCVDGGDDEPASKTDRYGRFALSDQAIGCDAIASHASHADSAVTTLKKGSHNLLLLKLPGSISGVVVNGDDKTLRTFVVSIDSYRAESGGPDRAGRYRQTFSHPQGKFTIHGLAAGTYELVITTRGGIETRSQPLHLDSGQQLTGVRIMVE